ncbi:peptidoglycan DD-metalloendopeptidase family protein [Marivirga lumbricoides]
MENWKILSYLRGLVELKIYRVFYFLIFLYPFYEPFKFIIIFIFLDVLYEILEKNSNKHSSRISTSALVYHPFLYWQSLCQMWGMLYRSFIASPQSYKDIAAAAKSEGITFKLPFEGKWYVYNGGIKKEDSHSWNIYNQRYAYDFVMIDEESKSYCSSAQDIEDYYCYGKKVLCPADGTIIHKKDGLIDYDQPGKINFWTKDFRGNFLIIEHSKKHYSFLAHFKKASITVNIGDIVKEGQTLGLCGNSGHSTEPHIHFHVQDHPNFYLGLGLPIPFFITDDAERQFISKGEFITAQH